MQLPLSAKRRTGGILRKPQPQLHSPAMRWLIDAVYLAVALITSPVWLVRMIRTGKIKTDWRGRLGHTARIAGAGSGRILVHTVSVGEVNAVELLLSRLAESIGTHQIIVSTTTDTGFARATSLYGRRFHVVRYPFDLSVCVERFLDAVRPDVVACFELELWPNFVRSCSRRGIGVCVINGRLSERSFRRYRLIRPLIRGLFGQVAFVAVQNEPYAARFRQLGVSPAQVHVTGTMKWDAAQITDDVEGSDELAAALGIDRARPLVVAGSTAPGEHELLVQAVGDDVQLLCAPRKPEWFDQAAAAMPGCARRSRGDHGSLTGRFLLDTIGELQQAYALADVVVVGRSFGALYGSNVTEPVALGKATIVGPAVGDFQDTVDALVAGEAIVQTTRQDLAKTVRDLLDDPQRRRALAENGRAVIRSHQGATDRNVKRLVSLLAEVSKARP